MSKIKQDLLYTKSHEWVRKEDENTVVVGITDHAQSLLGDLVFVELPEEDQHYNQGDDMCVLESVKAAADVYAPLAGTVIEVNEQLADTPESINTSCYDDAWICKMTVSKDAGFESLLSPEEYEQHIKSEQH